MQRQSDQELMQLKPNIQRIRYTAPDRVPADVLMTVSRKGFHIARAPVLMEGRIELLHYCINQSICHNYHRNGNISERAFQLNLKV